MKTYLILENNVVVNTCVWDGDVNTWQPPQGVTLLLLQETTPTKIWAEVDKQFVLIDSVGDARVGFTYDGAVCTTNDEKPEVTTPIGELPVTEIK